MGGWMDGWIRQWFQITEPRISVGPKQDTDIRLSEIKTFYRQHYKKKEYTFITTTVKEVVTSITPWF
jgi:hypothetical protein